jgi:hypothetical protein
MADNGVTIRPVPSFNFDVNQLLDAYRQGQNWRNTPLRPVQTQSQQPQQPAGQPMSLQPPVQPGPMIPAPGLPALSIPGVSQLALGLARALDIVPSQQQGQRAPGFDPNRLSSLY